MNFLKSIHHDGSARYVRAAKNEPLRVGSEVALHLRASPEAGMNTEYKRYLARIPKTYAIAKLGYSTGVFDREPVLIQPAYIQCAEPLDREMSGGYRMDK